jgi:hypothetical protein
MARNACLPEAPATCTTKSRALTDIQRSAQSRVQKKIERSLDARRTITQFLHWPTFLPEKSVKKFLNICLLLLAPAWSLAGGNWNFLSGTPEV